MGCDIHMWAEIRRREKEDVWEEERKKAAAENRLPEPEEDEQVWEKVGEVFRGWRNQKTDEPYHDRDYTLFGILAQVRREPEFGFGAPRGVPRNASLEYCGHVYKWGSDGHSHSYLTLKELLGLDWNRKSEERKNFLSAIDWSNLHSDNVEKRRELMWLRRDAVAIEDMKNPENRYFKESPEPQVVTLVEFQQMLMLYDVKELVELHAQYERFIDRKEKHNITDNWKIKQELEGKTDEESAKIISRHSWLRNRAQMQLEKFCREKYHVHPLYNVFVEYNYSPSYKESLSASWFGALGALKAYADKKGVGYEDVRVVFFFDN